MFNIKYFLIVQILFSFCLCNESSDDEVKLLNDYLDYYNNLPDQVYRSQDASLLSTQKVDESTYNIVVNVKAVERIQNTGETKSLKCSATIHSKDDEVTVTNNVCEDIEQKQSSAENGETTPEPQVAVVEPTVERNPVQLDNEVQDSAITSGEQFIAIPRDQPSAPCIGCASHVNPQAAGVSDLANLGLRHLDLHEPSVKHSLDSVIDVERQVQVVNGVRYILTLSINSDTCSDEHSENCASSKICKVTILVKPWVKLPNGGNFRSILANNCTEEWLHGDDGEVLPELPTDNHQNDKVKGNVDPNEDIQAKHNIDVQSQPKTEKTLSEEEIRRIQEQIIPNARFQEITEPSQQSFTTPEASGVSKQHVFKVESGQHNENSIPVTESYKSDQQIYNMNMDKRKAIDEMLDFFDFSGFKPKTEVEDVIPRVRRSYDYDLQVLSLVDDYNGIKNSIKNARFVYEMAQAMVDYMNEMDMEVKKRVVKHVLKAEDETENLQRFIYLQASVSIPCDTVECEPRDVETQICNGVIDCTNEKSPQILTTFCYDDNKESANRENNIDEIPLNDPVLKKLARDAVKKIESESDSPYAIRINKIASAITQVTSGRLTKISIIVENVKCNKTVPFALRGNCIVLEQLGTKICEVIVHEKHWLKEKRISYTCIDRPTDMRISNSKVIKPVTVDDPKINEMLQEAIQYLETQSDKSNKQKIVQINSISSQIIAGFLTNIEFVVGYTDCTDENYSRDKIIKCEYLKGQPLRLCKAQIWDRSWIMDGRQVEVSCEDITKTNETVKSKKKRSIESNTAKENLNLSKDNDDDIDYKKLANESLNKFMRSSSSHQHYEVVMVDKVLDQDVSRHLITIDFTISPTNCLINDDGSLSGSKCVIVNPKNIIHCRSKILQNNWIGKKQYFINCNIKLKYQQQKNSNEIKERDPSDPIYYQLAEESLAKHLQDTGNSHSLIHHSIARVDKVTTQIVNGRLTKIDFIITSKNQSARNNQSTRCHSEILERRWLGTKDFNVSCDIKHAMKVDVTAGFNIDDPKFMQIAVESLQKYIQIKPESGLTRVVFVDKVLQNGEKIKVRFIASHVEENDGDTICNTEVSATLMSKSDINVDCHLIGKIFKKGKVTIDDPNFIKYVELAEKSLRNLEMNNSSFYSIVGVESALVQWDEGIKTILHFTISPIDTESEFLQGKKCITEILEQPWLNIKENNVKCRSVKDLYRTKRQVSNERHGALLGSAKKQDSAKPEYRALAEESLRKYTINAGISHPLEVASVEKVTTQVVSGSLTKIDFLVSGYPGAELIKCHSEVWEQSWLNKKDIDVSCQTDGLRGKRQIPGGSQVQDPAKPEYRALAEESLRKYTINAGISHPLEVASVEKVTTQVVSGSLTKIDFLVSGYPGAELIKCHSEVWEQSWLNKKDIDVSCQTDGLRGKRQIPGGSQVQDPAKPEYRALAEESLRKYTINAGISHPLEVAGVEKVTTQVVSGSLTKIDFLVSGYPGAELIKCHSEVWEQSWLNKKDIDVSCQTDGLRGKRQIPGGSKVQDPANPEYRTLAEESLRKYTINAGISHPLEVASVEKVTTQVVSGSLTKIDFLVSGYPGAELIKCHSEVWEQSWLNKKDIDVSCQTDGLRGKRQIPGGSKVQDPANPEYRTLAEESLRKYTINAGISHPLEVAGVEKVTTQVVSGSLTKIDFLVSGYPGAELIKCHSEVWEQSWLNKKDIDVSCQTDGLRGKRQIPGGSQVQDPAKPEYRALAEESLRKYTINAGISHPLEVAGVEKVTTQVVSGSLTKIDFLVSGYPGAELIKCHSEVWEQSWLNKKDIDVSCQTDGLRGKRQIPGGSQVQDPAKPEYRALAEESLRKYTINAGISHPLEVAGVEKVTTQVVSGSLTKIDFLVSGYPGAELIKCHSEVWEQSWLNKKDIDVSCQTDGLRGKRQIPGGSKVQDPANPEYRTLAEESLRKYTINAGISHPLEVASVEKVTTQVVSGSLTKIDFLVSGYPGAELIKCHSEVWEQSWLNKKDIDVSCQTDGLRGKRQIPGGSQVQDPAKPEYRALAEESLRKYTINAGISHPLEVAGVEKVTTQVVSGSLTKIDFLVSGYPGAELIKCHSEVWEQSWLNKKDIDVSCQTDGLRGKRQIPGGSKVQDPANPEYRTLAEESLRKYTINAGISHPLEVASVEKVTTQVVSGSLTKIDFLVSGYPGAELIKCHSEVWEQSWLNKKDIDVSCQTDGLRGKRQIPGGSKVQDPANPEYRTLAEESLRKYTINAGISHPLEVAGVEKVTTQVVSGSLTKIDFLVSGYPGAELIKCHSEVWEQSWLNKKDIDVSCQTDGLRGKRQIPGGSQVQDPAKPEYRALAEESLRKYTINAGISHPLEVAGVEKVTTQVVSGSLTKIDFLVSGYPGAELIKCHSEVWEQSWLNKKDIDVSCQTDGLRGKRQIPGGSKVQDPANPEYRTLAEESLRKYTINAGISHPLEVASVEKVTTQVVSGSLTKIDFLVSGYPGAELIKCHSEVWEQSWLNKKDIDVSCQTDGLRGKRQIPGGSKVQDPANPEYRTLAEESLRKYTINAGISHPLEVAGVEKVTTQVVSGSLTKIDFLVSGYPGAELIKCHSEVWEQSWLNKKDIDVSCQTDGLRGKRQIPGGSQVQDSAKPEYRALAEESLRKYTINAGISHPLEVAGVEKVTTQVVSGSLTKIDFLVSGYPGAELIKCHSEVWEQSWLNKKDIDVSCQTDGLRGKRQIPGGSKVQDPANPEYRTLAEESLRKYTINAGISHPLKVASVEKVTTQVVSGSLTKIDFLVSGYPGAELIKCHSEVWEQSWLNKKDIDVSCQTDGLRGKRQIPGGSKVQDPANPEYRTLAEESLRKYTINAGISHPLEVASVEKVTTQVVSGSLTKIDFLVSGYPGAELIKCHSEVWEQSWLNKKDIDVSCQTDGLRGKRQIPGGSQVQDPAKPEYRTLAEESLRKYTINAGISHPLKVASVEKVTTQVVSGSLTKIDFLVSGYPGAELIKCHSEVWEQSWLNKKDIDVSCQTDGLRGKRQIPGGSQVQDPAKPEYRTLAEESLRKYTINAGISHPLEIASIEKVTTQVVSGSLTKIDFLVSGYPGAELIKCHSEVWEQSWLNKKDIDVSCQVDSHRDKRQIRGGLKNQDPSEPEYKALAEESLRKYTKDAGITHSLKVAIVEKATTQVVSGILTRIDFLVSGYPGAETIKCHSKVWEQSWLNKKDIDVSCKTDGLRSKRQIPSGVQDKNSRVKRDLETPSSASKINLRTPHYKGLSLKLLRGNNKPAGTGFRGRSEEEQDPNKEEYKILAEESLRKFFKKENTTYHKVVEVNRVVSRVVSGLKYEIDFTAAPTACSANVSSIRARNCKADEHVRLYCHTEIWDRPWLRQKKIDVTCNDPTDDELESENDSSAIPSFEKYVKLAEEASEKYLTASNRKYVHKVTKILSANEQETNATITNINYTLSPTTCLRNRTTNSTSCELKQPLVVFNCSANIRQPIGEEKEITVTCKKNGERNSKKFKRELNVRNERQISDDNDDDDNEIDEDTTFYYADRSLQFLNDQSSSNNLYKLVSIHAAKSSIQMETLTVKLYIEVVETFCLRHLKSMNLRNCEEMGSLNHKLCLARLWPSPDDELIVRHVSVVCDDSNDFVSITGVNIPELVKISINVLESYPENTFKLVHQGEPQVIPTLDSRRPFKINFVVGVTNCSKDVNLDKNPFQCFLNPNVGSRNCRSLIWLKPETRYISHVEAKCTPIGRNKRSPLNSGNTTSDYEAVQNMVKASLEKLEMQSLHRYKQRVLQINSHSTKITSGRVTTIDFDVGYTSCLKYEWVANITSCNFLEHLPRRRCVAQIWERLWSSSGRIIDVNCVDDETPLESHIEFESAEMANELARQALKHIEAKYPHPSKQKVVRIFSLEKQLVAGIHYKMKIEVGFTDCMALSDQKDCNFVDNYGLNKFCRVNVWIRPWTDHPPNFRVTCDFQEGTTHDLYHQVQAEQLFYNFLTTYSPSYVNNYSQMQKRFEVFKNNIKKIHELNTHEKGTAIYGVTRFTDLTYEEFSNTYMGWNKNLTNENQVPMKKADIPDIKVPLSFDWREHDAVTEVKDQGSCGSCWAFSVTGNIEGQWKMQSGQLVSLSEQELVDCDKLDDGCNGGLPDNAYRAIEQLGGLELETDYPYEGSDDKCVFNKTLAKVQISGAVNITTNETGMAQWLVQNGPISIGINANAMQFYMGGISHPWKMLCNPTNLDHGVLIVGYGVKDYPLFQKKLPFWIIKNSWGKSWGEQGYYRVFRGDGTCGLNQMASSAVI